MAAGLYNFTIEQGATLSFEIQYKDNSGTPIDLTGYNAKMEIASAYSGSTRTVYAMLTSSLGDTYTKDTGSEFLSLSGSDLTTPTTSGSIGIYIGWARTNELVFTGSAVYDLELTVGTERTRLLQGQVQLSKQVTNEE